MTARRDQHNGYLYLAAAAAVVVVIVLFVFSKPYDALSGVLRATATMGYLCVLASIISTAYLRPLVRFFGRSFIKVHHTAAIAALVLVTLHPIAAIFVYGPGVLLPVVDSFPNFMRWAGPIVWVLLAIAVVAALLKSPLPARLAWRTRPDNGGLLSGHHPRRPAGHRWPGLAGARGHDRHGCCCAAGGSQKAPRGSHTPPTVGRPARNSTPSFAR